MENSKHMSPWLKMLIVAALAVILGCSAALGLAAFNGGGGDDPTTTAKRKKDNGDVERLEAERRTLERSLDVKASDLPPASAGTNGTTKPSQTSTADLSGPFSQLEAEIPGRIGLSVAPLGGSPEHIGGSLTSGHAWSSFKVPLIATLMREQQGSLTSGQKGFAAAAITTSDNEAAAALFNDLESVAGGGLAGASQAIERTLADAGGPALVTTAPPPPGAVSTWGQTDWSLDASTAFYAALACGALLPSAQSEEILGLMAQITPEQQWGLGSGTFTSDIQVAFKGGWGPGAVSGGYLVRQTGVLRASDGSGLVVTIAAEDESGTFEAGVADLNEIAAWVSQNVPLKGGC